MGEVWENDVGVDVLLSFRLNLGDSSEATMNLLIALRLFVKYSDGESYKRNMNPDWYQWL